MDKQIEKKRWSKKRWLSIGLSVIAVILIISAAANSRSKRLKLQKNQLTYTTVQLAEFQDMVSFQGAVEPTTSIQLDASEGGIVEEIFVEDGSMVEKGQPLLRLSNTNLKLDFMNRETQIVEQINNLRSTRISLDQNKRQVQEQVVDLNYQLIEQKRKFQLDSSLFAQKVISENEFLASKANYKYLVEKKDLLNDRLKTDEAYRISQLNSIDASMEMMERNLEAIRKNLENLVVKAAIAGQLNSFDHEIGQTKAKGENLGRIDVLGAYQISAFVDQYYLNRINLGQTAKAVFSGKEYELQVNKIFPTIVNNQFEVHLSFKNELPQTIRRGQNVQVRLELSAKKMALMVERGSFSQSNQGKYAFVVEEDKAIKREVKFGLQNSDYIEVIEGLAEGETIISSNYNSFGEAEEIILND